VEGLRDDTDWGVGGTEYQLKGKGHPITGHEGPEME
jgi:hypothetical protein